MAPWLRQGFVRRNRGSLRGYRSRVRLLGPLPSFQYNLDTLNYMRRAIEYFALPSEPLHEKRFPYLDQGFLEFMSYVPREVVVRVGQRRFLMKRALLGIVPDEILNRKKRQIVPQKPTKDSSTEWPSLAEIGECAGGDFTGIVDQDRFLESLQKAQQNVEVPIESLKRTLVLESWLSHLAIHGVLTNSIATKAKHDSSSLDAKELKVPTQPQNLAS